MRLDKKPVEPPIQTTCRKCGTPIVQSEDDRRRGYCFDCLDLSAPSERWP